ncbi:hypothetical protein BA898_06085 [Spiribacter roseus]|nr:hypothetical protein BA898_06085 [Spiribacter roseus]
MARRRFFSEHSFYIARFVRSQNRELWIRSLMTGARIAKPKGPLIHYETGYYSRSYAQIGDQMLLALMIGR